MKEITLKYKIIIGSITIILIPFLIAGIITYKRISSSLEKLSRERSTQIASDIANLLQVTSLEETKVMASIALNPYIIESAESGDYRLADLFLAALYKNIGNEYEDFFVTDMNGIVRSIGLDPRRKGINISDRDYFLSSKKGIPAFSIPVISKATGNLIMVVSYPIRTHSGEIIGIVGGPLKIDFMIRNISSIKLGSTGYPFIVDSRGIVIVHHDTRHILKTNMYQLEGTRDITRRMMNNETGSGSYIYDGIKKIAGFAPVQATGWKVVFTQNEDEIFAPSDSVLQFILFSGLIMISVVIAGFVILSRRISRSVEDTIRILEEITGHSNEIVLTIGSDKRIDRANKTFEEFTGLSVKDYKGEKPLLANTNNISDDLIWETLEKGGTWAGRIIYKTPSANESIVSTIIFPVKNEHQQILSYISIGRDITDELLIENRMKQAQKIEAIGTLAGGIAHDFNNILTAIFGYAQLSLMNPGNTEKTKKNIEDIIRAADRARELVQQILTFSRKTEVEFKPIQVASVIKESMALLRATIPSSIALSETINSDAFILGDRTQLQQVLINLFTNASHAIQNNKGSIDIILKDLIVDREFTSLHPGLSEGKHVQITVSDSGKGIEPDIIERIFDPFFTTKKQGEGTGLGLSVAHGIINKFNGVITVYSDPGHGTTFNVIIPAIPEEAVGVSDSPAEADVHGGTERILLIDDETAILDSFKKGLEEFGYSVSSFSDASEAISAFKSDPASFDIIITDYTMPDMTGLEVAGAIRESNKTIPVIMISGYIDHELEDLSKKAGVKEIVKKPVTISEISSAVRRVLNKKDPDNA